MENNTPAAAAPATAPATEATPNTNSNPDTTTPPELQTPAITLEQAAQFIGMKPEALEERMRVEKANGGPEKCFENFKKYTADPSSRPSAQQPSEPQTPVQPMQPVEPQIQSQPQMQKPAEGYLTANDIAKLQYNKMLSEAYSELDKEGYITKGEFVKEATAMGIPVMDQAGNMNDAAIRKFLDLKKATLPPAPASAPITTTPTVDYQQVEGEIDSKEKANMIIKQGDSHPQFSAAMDYIRNSIWQKPDAKK